MNSFAVPPAVPLRDVISRPARRFSPSLDLVCFFPPTHGLKGAETTVSDLGPLYRRGLTFPSKRVAVTTVVAANMERHEAQGHGNAAVRRAHRHFFPPALRASA